MRSNFKHTKCKGSPFSVCSTYACKKGVNTAMFKNSFERSIYHNQPMKESKSAQIVSTEHGWNLWFMCVRWRDESIDSSV
jgi:hypothetical protein